MSGICHATDAEVAQFRRGRATPPVALTHHWRLDDRRAGFTGAAADIVRVPDRGRSGTPTDLQAGTGSTGPVRSTISGRLAGDCTSARVMRLTGTSTTLLQAWNDPASNCSIFFVLYIDAVGTLARPICITRTGIATTNKGVIIVHTAAGAFNLLVSDGLTQTLNLTGANLGTGLKFGQLVKAGLAFELFFNGVSYVSGSASAMIAGTSTSCFFGAAANAGTLSFDGKLGEIGISLSSAWSAPEVASVQSYLAGRYP